MVAKPEMKADRISELPGHVIDQILSCLPIQDAARASILSTQWRHYWLSISSLTFKCNHFLDQMDEDREDHRPESIIYSTLLLHTGPIHKFSLRCSSTISFHAIYCWLKFLSNHPIRVLELSNSSNEPRFEMPYHFYSFDHLTRMTLTCVVIKTPPGFKGFKRLVSLSLNVCRIEYNDLTKIVSQCPQLETLTMFDCMRDFGYLYIPGPKLKYFEFVGRFCKIYLDAVGLEELTIIYRDLDLEYAIVVLKSLRIEGNLIAAFGCLPSVRKLRLHDSVLQFLAMFSIPENPVKLQNLTVIQIWKFQFEEVDSVRAALGLLRSSPNLQRLEIAGKLSPLIYEDVTPKLATIKYLKAQQERKAHLPYLKNVVFHFMLCSTAATELVRLILRWANVLEKLAITSIISGTLSGADPQVFEQLASLRLASSAEIIIG